MVNESASSRALDSEFDDLRAEKSQTASGRIAWLDAAKGLGIILVVTFHAVGGSLQAGLIPKGGILDDAFYVVYTFHMPLFFFLSGLLLKDRLRDQNAVKTLLGSSVRKLLYPCFLWGYIQVFIISSLGKFVNTPVSFGWFEIISPLWAPPSQFWFLYVLFVFQLVSVCCLYFGREILLVCIAVLLRIIVSVFFDAPAIILPMGEFGIFYVAAIFAGTKIKSLPSIVRYPGPTSVALFAATISLALIYLKFGVGFYDFYALPAAILGTLAVLTLSVHPRISSSSLLSLLGRRSLTIFLMHVLCVAGTRIVLVKLLHIESAWIVIPLAILAGLAVPVVLYDLSAKWKLRELLGFS